MVYVAQMTTNYPDFHGTGYVNYIMDEDKLELDRKIEQNSHDFRLVAIKQLMHYETVQDVINAYPTKQDIGREF